MLYSINVFWINILLPYWYKSQDSLSDLVLANIVNLFNRDTQGIEGQTQICGAVRRCHVYPRYYISSDGEQEAEVCNN